MDTKEANAMDTETLVETLVIPINVKNGCICRNHGRPINGRVYIEPCCPVHYAEKGIPQAEPEEEITEEERAAWASEDRKWRRKRVTYPKMAVAKS